MRKADYTLLARLIRELYAHHNSALSRLVLGQLAREFANAASVNKTEFLKACGIE